MAVNAMAVGYATAGGILLYAGAKGATVSATVKGALSGDLSSVTQTQPVTMSALLSSIASAFTGGLLGGSSSSSSSGETVDSGSSSAAAAANQETAKEVMKKLGSPYSSWTTGQNWTDLVALWNRESGWSATAKNPTSGAYGIAQALPATKYPAAGQESGGSNPGAQISWGLEYIKGRYGSPVMAWAHEQANGWY